MRSWRWGRSHCGGMCGRLFARNESELLNENGNIYEPFCWAGNIRISNDGRPDSQDSGTAGR